VAIRTAWPVAPPAAKAITALIPRPGSPLARAALVTVNLAAVTFFLLSYSRHGVRFGPYGIDLDVYRIGGHAWLTGADLYGRLPPTRFGARLPFTYPPIAAVLLSPLSLVPMPVAGVALALCTVALIAVVLRVFLSRLIAPQRVPGWALAWLLPPVLFLEPVRNTLTYGQINVILMALVTLDCLTGAPRWPRGTLVGLAAAVKLTPMVFVLFFLLRRDYRAAATASGSFATATGVGFLLAWPDSVQYWTRIAFQITRIGDPAYAANQSIEGVLTRAGLGPGTLAGTAVWLALSIAVLLMAGRGMRHAFTAGENGWALSINAFAVLLISPISWSHHWVWSAPAVLTLAVLGYQHRSRLSLATAACGILVFAAAPQWWFPSGHHRELRWAVWQQVIGSSYVIFAVLILVLSAAAMLTPRATPEGDPRRHRRGQPAVSSLVRCSVVSSRSTAARLSSSCATEEAPISGMTGTSAPISQARTT
jgi:alpha-1,2-mannosyltransferase